MAQAVSMSSGTTSHRWVRMSMSSSGLDGLLWRGPGLGPPRELPDQHEKQRDEEDRKKRCGKHAAEDSGSNGMSAGRAGSRRPHQRDDAKNERHGRHNDRP